VAAAGVSVPVHAGETVVVAPGDLPATFRSGPRSATALHGWVPNWARDIEAPARAAGASAAEIAALAGPLA
jgi:hypothetical protein